MARYTLFVPEMPTIIAHDDPDLPALLATPAFQRNAFIIRWPDNEYAVSPLDPVMLDRMALAIDLPAASDAAVKLPATTTDKENDTDD